LPIYSNNSSWPLSPPRTGLAIANPVAGKNLKKLSNLLYVMMAYSARMQISKVVRVMKLWWVAVVNAWIQPGILSMIHDRT
ncbi:hypothetical protein, partial [Aeromonas caviae]|uniref:hypothetical protein n=1 Tax=Aeromonas caviae TaxID=648 RepID=UPI002B48C8F3